MLPDLSRHLESQTSEREKCSGICDSTIWTPIIEVTFLAGMFENWRAWCEHHFGFAKVLLCAWAIVKTTEKSCKK